MALGRMYDVGDYSAACIEREDSLIPPSHLPSSNSKKLINSRINPTRPPLIGSKTTRLPIERDAVSFRGARWTVVVLAFAAPVDVFADPDLYIYMISQCLVEKEDEGWV